MFLDAVSEAEENVIERRHVELNEKRAGVCLKTKCPDAQTCDQLCKDGRYRGGICLPPANTCCCLY